MQLVKDTMSFLLTIATLAIAGAAWATLLSWRRDLQMKRDSDLVREMLDVVYQARGQLLLVRRLHRRGESPRAVLSREEAGEIARILEQLHPVVGRAYGLRAAFAASHGVAKARPIDDLLAIFEQMKADAVALKVLYRDSTELSDEEVAQDEDAIRLSQGLCGPERGADQVSQRISHCLETLEKSSGELLVRQIGNVNRFVAAAAPEVGPVQGVGRAAGRNDWKVWFRPSFSQSTETNLVERPCEADIALDRT